MNDIRISESELLELIKNLLRLPKEDYKKFIFPANVRNVFILPVIKNDEINGFYFITEPSVGYYFKSVHKETSGRNEIFFQAILTAETLKENGLL